MTVDVVYDGPLTIVEWRSPPLNLFDASLIRDLEAALDAIESRPGRGVLIQAVGRVVSGGVDVHVFDALAGVADAEALFQRLLTITRRWEALPVPTVFAAHGLCLTAAFELALASDLIVAAESARFGLVERVVGLAPAMGGVQRLAARCGPGRARELVMTGAIYGVFTLADWGVVNRVFPDSEFRVAARDFALHIAVGPTVAHALTKRLVRVQQEDGVSAADDITARAASLLFETDDVREGLRSFLDSGPGNAVYSGR